MAGLLLYSLQILVCLQRTVNRITFVFNSKVSKTELCVVSFFTLTLVLHAGHTAIICSFFFFSTYRPIGGVLLRVTAAMAGAVCGQTLPVVVKAQTISRFAEPLFQELLLFFFFCCHSLGCTLFLKKQTAKSMEVKQNRPVKEKVWRKWNERKK